MASREANPAVVDSTTVEGPQDQESRVYPPPIAGSKRKRINFVPASRPQESAVTDKPSEAKPSTSQSLYLAILGRKEESGDEEKRGLHEEEVTQRGKRSPRGTITVACPECGDEVSLDQSAPGSRGSIPHEASLAHQLSLQHSHPPSAINRKSRGFSYLSSYGWDPDKRVGLGSHGEGRLNPVRAVHIHKKTGIGAAVDPSQEPRRPERKEPLTKGQAKAKESEQKLKDQRFNDLVMGRDDVNNYLGIRL